MHLYFYLPLSHRHLPSTFTDIRFNNFPIQIWHRREEFSGKKIFKKILKNMECIGIDDSKAIALLRMGKNGGKAQSVKDTDVTRRKRGKDDSRHRCAVDICHFSLCIGWKRRGEPFLPAIRERFPRGVALQREIRPRDWKRVDCRSITAIGKRTNVSSRCEEISFSEEEGSWRFGRRMDNFLAVNSNN